MFKGEQNISTVALTYDFWRYLLRQMIEITLDKKQVEPFVVILYIFTQLLNWNVISNVYIFEKTPGLACDSGLTCWA